MRRRLFGPEAVLLAAGLLLALLIGELALRVVGYRYSPLKVVTPLHKSDWRYHHVFESADFSFDPELIWRPVAGRGVFNAQGVRGRELTEPKAPATLRILAVGDSNTLGHQGLRGANWPLLMEAHDARLRVVNAGVYGYSSFQGVRRLRQCLGFDPDVVLISFGGNDGHPVGIGDAEYARRLSARQGLLGSVTVLRVGQLLLDAFDKLHALGSAQAPASRRVELAEYRQNLLEMIRSCRARRALPVLLTRPFLGHTHDPESWKSAGPDYNQATREIGLGEGVLVVDLYARFKRRRDMFEDESHFTDKGHWEAAAYVVEQLAPSLAEREAAR